MTEETALTTRPSALDIYGESEDIKKMAARLKLCLPGGNRLNDAEALALAQLSIAYNLNPFNGEVWYIPGKGTMVGIKGHRKVARKQAQYWIEHILLTPDERTELAIPDEAIAYKCLVYRSDLIRQSAEAIKLMHDAGMDDAAERYAYKPTTGIGYWVPGEQTRMKGDQAARKRAEADALKMAFDLPFASEVGNGDRIGYIDAEDYQIHPPSPERQAKTSRQLYGDPDFEGYDSTEPEPEDPPRPTTNKCPICQATGDSHAPWCQEIDGERTDTRTRRGASTAAPQPAPQPKPPTPKPNSGNGHTKPATVRAANWSDAAATLAAEEPYYMTNGQVNYYHLTGAAAKAGYPEITDQNLDEVIDALRQYARDQQALAAAEEEEDGYQIPF